MTKNELVKALNREKERQLNILTEKNNVDIKNLKKKLIKDLFAEDITELNKIGVAYSEALAKFAHKVKEQNYTMGFEFYSNILTSCTLIRSCSSQTEEGIIECLLNNQYIIGNTVLGNKIARIRESETELEDEWNKLIIIIKGLSLKEGRKYLEECKIEIPGMNEEPKQTALVNYTVDVTKLFIKEEA